jgi:RimJ/RimL family protein N-acetyltransferase
MAAQPIDDISILARTGPEWARLESFPLFADAQASAAAMTSTALAETWADAIVRCWQRGLDDGSINVNLPVHVLDLCPAQGRLAWLMLGALQSRLQQGGLSSSLTVRYVACCEDASSRDRLLAHPWFSGHVAGGTFDAALWSGTGSDKDLVAQHGVVDVSGNPLTVLSLGYFGSLPSELWGVHYGAYWPGLVALQPDETRVADEAANASSYSWRLDIDWQMQAKPQMPSALQAILEQYVQRVPSAVMLLPAAAIETIDTIRRLSADRYLLLSADRGVSTEQQIRQGALRLSAQWNTDSHALPVNYHALSMHEQKTGAWTWSHQLQDGGIVMHAAWSDWAVSSDVQDAMPEVLEQSLSAMHPDDGEALMSAAIDSAAYGDMRTSLSFLRMSRHDPKVLRTCINTLIQHADSIGERLLDEWRAALTTTWQRCLPVEDEHWYHDLGLLASALRHWGLAKECFRTGLMLHGDNVEDLSQLARCEDMTGHCAEAEALLARALQIRSRHGICVELHRCLAERLQTWQSADWYRPLVARDGELTLEPFGVQHAEAYVYQSRDPQIAVMARMPELNTVEDVRQWACVHKDNPRYRYYAVMHDEHGFIGMVGMLCENDAGYFFFWTGADYQNFGYGRRAAKLLFAQARDAGVKELFTAAYQDNKRSIVALSSLGFKPLDIRSQAPDDVLTHFHVRFDDAVSMEKAEVNARLKALCAEIGSKFVFEDVDEEVMA